MRDARPLASAASPALQLIEVDDVFERIAATAGRGSPADRVRMLRELLARATGDEHVALEWKLDGARIQVHKAGDEVKV